MKPRNDLPPVVCDMTGAADTAAERIGEYRRLFTQSLLGRDRTGAGIRFRFRAGPGMQDWLGDLARREEACCAFFSFTVTAGGEEVWWDVSVIDDDVARRILDEFYHLPDTIAQGAAAVRQGFRDQGLLAVTDDGVTRRPAGTGESGSSESG